MFPEWNWRQYLFSQNLPHIQHVGVREASAQRGATTGASPGTTAWIQGLLSGASAPLPQGRKQQKALLFQLVNQPGQTPGAELRDMGVRGVCV